MHQCLQRIIHGIKIIFLRGSGLQCRQRLQKLVYPIACRNQLFKILPFLATFPQPLHYRIHFPLQSCTPFCLILRLQESVCTGNLRILQKRHPLLLVRIMCIQDKMGREKCELGSVSIVIQQPFLPQLPNQVPQRNHTRDQTKIIVPKDIIYLEIRFFLRILLPCIQLFHESPAEAEILLVERIRHALIRPDAVGDSLQADGIDFLEIEHSVLFLADPLLPDLRYSKDGITVYYGASRPMELHDGIHRFLIAPAPDADNKIILVYGAICIYMPLLPQLIPGGRIESFALVLHSVGTYDIISCLHKHHEGQEHILIFV